jgi:hypothetical protein
MQSEKFSLFDFLAFAIPGGTFLIICYILSYPYFNASSIVPDVSEYFFIAPYILLSYFVGHILSAIGYWAERNYTGQRHPWMKYLENNLESTNQLDQINNTIFKTSFFEIENDTKRISSKKSSLFFDNAYTYLEMNHKSDKVGVLMVQYAFFRNCSALWVASFLCSIWAIIYRSFVHGQFFAIMICSALFILFSIFSIYLMRSRKLLMMAAVYQSMIILSINNHNIKNHEKRNDEPPNQLSQK